MGNPSARHQVAANQHNDRSEQASAAGNSRDREQSGFDETIAVGGGASTGSGEAAAGSTALIGQQVGKYKIIAALGCGGMGVVYRAYDETIEREVAIKILPAELAANPTALERFLSEAKAAGKLSHPNTVTIHEIARHGEHYMIVMELVGGGSLDDELKRTRVLSVLEASRVMAEACKGLAAAHAAGLVHRDIKPANLLRTSEGSVKIADFGLAKAAAAGGRQVTQAGQVVGTPYFMSPEQCESRPVDYRSDIYSLGATYYSLLTGANPYADASSTVQIMYSHCHADVPDPQRIDASIPAACGAIVARAMAKSPDDRYQSAGEMLADLNAVIATLSGVTPILLPSQSGSRAAVSAAALPERTRPPARAERRLWALAGGAVLLAAAGVFVVSAGKWRPSGPMQDGGGQDSAASGGALAAPGGGPPIKVGILHSLSGTMAHSESAVVDAALLAIDQVNLSGGLLGRRVEAVVRDGRSDPAIFAREAQRLIAEDGVSTVFGCWTSASRKTVVPIFEEHDHLLVYPVQYEGIEESPNVVYTGAAPNQQIIPAVKWAFAFQNHRRFFLVGSDYVFPRTAGQIIKDTLDQLGAELVGEEYLPLGSMDAKALVAKVAAARPDVILNTINGDSNIAFFSELRTAGITPERVPTISFSIGEAELQHLNVAEMVGDFAAWNYFQSVDSPENAQFVEAFKTRYGPQRVVTDPMEAAWFGVKLWAQAVVESASDQPAEIRRALRNQRMHAPEGEVRIDAATQHTFKTPRIGRIIEDGQFEIVWTAARPEPPQPYPPSRTTEQWKALLHDLYTGWGGQWAAPAR